MRKKATALRCWNGRPYALGLIDPDLHVCLAAYSIADAQRVCTELGFEKPSYREITEYWSERWGNDMAGIVPERGLWFVRERGKPERQTLRMKRTKYHG